MNHGTYFARTLLLAAWLAGSLAPLTAGAQNTSFTYQGRLQDGTNAASGTYDFVFRLSDAATNGNFLGSPITNTLVPVNGGWFTAGLDFGNFFDGNPRWVELAVRTNGGGTFTTLTPRQAISAAPYALHAVSASNLSGTISAGQVSGVLGFGQLPGSLVTNNASGVNLSGSFTGNGAGLSSLPATQLTGSVPWANSVEWLNYTNRGAYIAYPSNGIGSTQYIVSGANGIHYNSAGTGIDFSGANGTYVWCPTCAGLVWRPSLQQTNIGVFTNTLNNGWFMGFTYSGVAGDYYGSWTIYTTNNAIQYQDTSTHNAVLFANGVSDYLPDLNNPTWWTYQPDGQPSQVYVTPVMTNITQTVSVPKVNPLKAMLDFPTVGPSRSYVYRYGAPLNGMPTTQYNGVLNLTNGAGVIREITVIPTVFPWGLQTNFFLQIFPDCGNAGNGGIPPSNYMTFNAPLSVLASCRYTPGNGPSRNYDTRYVSTQQNSTNYGYDTTALSTLVVSLKMPCPFTNGCYIALKQATGGEYTNYMFSTVNYSLDPSGQLNYPFANWRLRSRFSRGGYGQPNPSGATADWNSIVPIILDAKGPGVMVGIWCSFDLSNNGAPMESTWQIWTDGQAVPWQSSGGEDLFLNPWEFINGGNIMNYDFGTPNRVSGQYCEFYRQFGPETAVYWNTSAYGVFPNEANTANPINRINEDILVVYYGP